MTSGWQTKLARISCMDWDEVRTRFAQELCRRSDLVRHRLGMRPEPVHLHKSSPEGNFFFARGEAAARAELLQKHLPDENAAIVQEANDICHHRFRLLGYDNLDFGAGQCKDIDWHLDPIRGKRAPLDLWFRIPFLEFAIVGDHKIIWELNRHQHLVTLAKAWLLTQDEKYVHEVKSQWYSWVKANPYPLGINWASTLEVAFRSLSWVWVDHLLADSPTYSEFRRDLLGALAFHGRYIERYLSTYFSPNTHLLGETVAIFFLGTLYPQMPHATRWRTRSWPIVLREAGRQVRPDGVYFEQSLYYHVYALDMFLYARMLAAANEMSVPTTYDQVLARMLDVIGTLAQAGPAEGFGDDDGGRLFNPRRNQTEHMTDPLALGALIFQCADFTTAHLTEESIWIFGDRAVAKLAAAGAKGATNSIDTLALRSVAFADGGIYVLSDSVPCPQTLMIDAGPQGGGRCGHGHADALSLRLTMNGARWLADSGSGVYVSSDPADRNTFRGTAAHNTIRVDGLDQAVPGEPFSWARVPASRTQNWVAARTFSYFKGSHDGYARLADAVLHHRMVLRVNGCGNHNDDMGLWLVRDVLLGKAEHDLELFWHFAADVALREPYGGEIVASRPQSGQPVLRIFFPEETAWKTKVSQGLLSPAYGQYQPAPLVRSEARLKLPAEIATAFIVEAHGAPASEPVHMVSVPHAATHEYGLNVRDETHRFFFRRDVQKWRIGPWASDAEVLYCRTSNERLTQLIVIGGSVVEWQDRPLLEPSVPFTYFEWRKKDGTMEAKPVSLVATPWFDELITTSLPSSSTISSDVASSTSSFAGKH